MQSTYVDESSTMTCVSRSQCFELESKDKIDEEYGDEVVHPPLEYDPLAWGWELTGLSLCKYIK